MLAARDGAGEEKEADAAVIEVCCGEDCLGVCAGAALIEIEELCREERHKSQGRHSACRVERTECQGACGKGPNVRVRDLTGRGQTFSGVDTPKKCTDVVASVVGEGKEQEVKGLDFCVTIMRRRAEGMRWKALKGLYRECQRGVPASWAAIEEALAAEGASGDGSAACKERGERRLERIKEVVCALSRPAIRGSQTESFCS